MSNRLGDYRTADTLGKSQLELILQVYDGALQACRQAGAHYRADELESGYEALEKVKRFVTHLYTTLDFEQGGEVASNLGQMYAFIINESNAIQGTKNMVQLEAMTRILGNLREGWAALRSGEAEPKSAQAAPAAPASAGAFVVTG